MMKDSYWLVLPFYKYSAVKKLVYPIKKLLFFISIKKNKFIENESYMDL